MGENAGEGSVWCPGVLQSSGWQNILASLFWGISIFNRRKPFFFFSWSWVNMRQLIKIIKFSITFSYLLSIFFNVSWTHRLLYHAIGEICFDSLSFCIKASHRLSSVLQEPPLNGYVFIRSRAPYSRSAKVWYLYHLALYMRRQWERSCNLLQSLRQ